MKTIHQSFRAKTLLTTRIRGKWQFPISTALALAAMFALTQLAGAQTSYLWNASSGNWSTATNWSPNTPDGGPTTVDSVTFGNNDTSADSNTVNNVVDAGFAGTIANLTYDSISIAPFEYNVTQIPSGQTLTVTNGMLVGGLNEGTGPYLTYAIMTGGGTFMFTGTNLAVENYGSAAGANDYANLDLSTLSNFIFNSANGTISIADTTLPQTSGSHNVRAAGNFSLAGVSNFITAATINLATCTAPQAGPTSTLALGAGTNIINVANFNIANNKNPGNVVFAASTGGLRIRGVSGTDTDRANITIGNRNVGNGTGTTPGQMLLDGHPVDILAGTLTVGEISVTAGPSGSGNGGQFGTGTLQFDTGIIDATKVVMGLNSAPNAAGGLSGSTSTLTVGANATLDVGAGGLSLINQTASNVCSSTLIISNGTVICDGNITVVTNAAAGTGASTETNVIDFIGGGTLTLGSDSVAGTTNSPIGQIVMDTNSTLRFVDPSATQPSVVVNSLIWPADDSALTIAVDGFVGVTNGSVIPLISFATMSGGTYTAPVLNLPAGITGSLSLSGNTIWLTVTGGIVPGIGGLNQLVNSGFEQGTTGWSLIGNILNGTGGNLSVKTVGSITYNNSGATCPADPTAELVVSHSGTNVANSFGAFTGGINAGSWSQEAPTVAGATFASGVYAYISHEDLMTGSNSFWCEVDFLDDSGTLLGSYESFVVTNLDCGQVAPFTVDAWNFLGVTNEMQVINGTNTGVVLASVPDGVLTAPPGTANVRFSAIFLQQAGYDGGSVYFDDANLGLINGPVPPTLSAVTPNLVTLCTNTTLTCTASSTQSTINTVQVIVTSNTLGGIPTTTINTANTDGSSPGLTVAGIGTSTANISYVLATNTMYSIIVKVTDANNVTVSSGTNTLDTLTPNLVIEAADFNFSQGQFIDTPVDGGLWLYANKVGVEGYDEHKAPRTSAQIYRPLPEAVIIQPAAPNTGTPPTATEQKFVTAAANGDTNDVEVEVGYNGVGDWLNYTRTYGPGGSAPAGTYNVWCYLATSGTGTQSTLSLVTSDPTLQSQTTNFLGYFGTTSFTDNGYNNYRYVPLTDQYGNRVSVTFTNGQQTLKATVAGNPNIGFYILVPVAPVLTPVLQYNYPNGSTPFQTSGQFTFTVGPADGAPIDTNDISLVLNGVDVSSGLTFTQQGGSWVANYTLQSNILYTAVINVTNTDGLYSTYSSSFDTFDPNNYQWEAVDYDFSTNNPDTGTWVGGLYIDNPVPTGDTNGLNGQLLETNSYFCYPGDWTIFDDGYGAVAQQGIDVNYAAASGMTSVYRADTVGTEVSTDYLRPKFLASRTNFSDPIICEFDLGWFNGGDWVNYTRDYPTNTYNIWGRLAGGAGAFSGTTMSLVTGDLGTSNQTTQVLGSFGDVNAAGWQVWHWVPMLDSNGNKVVVQLGGKATLRLTSGNNLNALFFMLTPATLSAEPFNLSASSVEGQLQISIPTQNGFNYTLWYASSLPATSWTQVLSTNIPGDGTVHVITQPLNGSQGYYRVSSQ